jgi:AraC family transcriptional regulator
MDLSARNRERYRHRLAPVVDYVRENLDEALTVEELARVVHFSPYHFHRLYSAVMGETVGELVRRVRLERAVQIMRTVPRRPLSRVAAQAGFSSASDFSRSFRRRYGLAPSRWDRRSPLAAYPGESTDCEPDPLLGVMAPLADEDPRAPVEVQLQTIPAATLAYVRVDRPMVPGNLTRGCRTLSAWLRADSVHHGGLLGLSWDQLGVTPPDQVRYDLACPIPADVEPPQPVLVRRMQELTVATARARGSLARVAHVWDHLYMQWLPGSRFEPFNFPAFERYRDWPGSMDGDQWDLDCCIPVTAARPGRRSR